MRSQKQAIYKYTAGFAVSIVCTMAAYLTVIHNVFSGWQLTLFVSLLAIVQIIVQLVIFLHIAEKGKSFITALVLTTAGVVVVLVFGTIWIMNNLSYNMSPSHDMDQEIIEDELINR